MNATARIVIRYGLIAALLWGVGLRFYAISEWKQGLSHDESVSYLCAAATEAEYQERIESFTDSSITVSSIQEFYARPQQIELGVVAKDLVNYDIHPPLYFWALHIQHVLVGSGISGGLWLNFGAGLIMLLLTYLVARRALGTVDLALVACAIWFLSPAVVQIDLEARQYQFMALCAMASYLLVIRSGPRGMSTGELALFTLVNAFGLLSHYYYSFVLVPGVVIVFMRHGLKWPLYRHLGSLVLSFGLFVIMFPEFLDFVVAYAHRPKDPSAAQSVAHRTRTIAYAALAFFAQANAMRYLFLLLVGAGISALAFGKIKRRITAPFPPSTAIGEVALILGWCAFFTVGLYLLGVSPPHAAGEQYFAYFWPLVAIVLVHVAGLLLPARSRPWILIAYMLQLGYAFTTSVSGSEYLQRVLPAAWYDQMGTSELLIADDWKRSFLPRAMRDLPAETPLYLMGQGAPATEDLAHVTFLHLAIDGRPPATALTERLIDQGFVHGEVSTHRHYELHTYTR